MSRPEPETIRVGVSGARIVAVTSQRVDYIDMAGQEQFIDLEECAREVGAVVRRPKPRVPFISRRYRAKHRCVERALCRQAWRA